MTPHEMAKKTTFAAVATVALLFFGTAGAAAPLDALPVSWQSFELDTFGWFPNGGSEVERVATGSGADEEYAPGVESRTGLHHARLRPGAEVPGAGNPGPFTNWGGPLLGPTEWPETGYVTQVRVYLDTAYATRTDVRFDFSSAINRPDGNHLRDFVFNAGTTPDDAPEFVVSASHNAFRHSSWPSNPGRDPVWIEESGWYTFRHTFTEDDGALRVSMQIFDDDGVETAGWVLGGDPIAEVGGFRYGWFANQEIEGLVIDDALRVPNDVVGELLLDTL